MPGLSSSATSSKNQHRAETVNMDSAEVAKFDALASRWWDEEGDFKPLHDINPLRLDFIDARAGLSGKKVLDVGCGGGILSEAMARRGARVQGLDMGAAPLDVARLHAADQGLEIDYHQMSVEEMASQMPGTFDVITCMEMLEHVPDPASVVAACARLVKPGGHVFFSTINRTVTSYAFAIIGAERVLKLLPRGTHEHKRFIRPSELATYCRASTLKVQEETGLVYHPITQRYRLSPRDVKVNYIMHCQHGGVLS